MRFTDIFPPFIRIVAQPKEKEQSTQSRLLLGETKRESSYLLSKKRSKYGSNQRLDKKELAEKRERKIKAYQFQPIR